MPRASKCIDSNFQIDESFESKFDFNKIPPASWGMIISP